MTTTSTQHAGRRTRISIAMTTCNGEAYVAAQLESFANQTLPPDEVIICDDASTDSTVTMLRAFQARVSFRVEFVENPTRLGIVGNFEQAIRKCTGDLIFLSDQDDVWLPGKLRAHAEAHTTRPGVGFVFSDARVTDSSLQPQGTTLFESLGITRRRLWRIRRGQLFDMLLCRPMIHGFTMSFDASLRRILLPIPAEYLHDVWTAYCLSVCTRCWPITEELALYRRHGGQAVGLRPQTEASVDVARAELNILTAGLRSSAARFSAHSDSVIRRDYARLIESRIAYQQSRVAPPTTRFGHALRIATNSLTGRYLRFSASIKRDVLEDLRALLSTR